jgi:hypothetical protein
VSTRFGSPGRWSGLRVVLLLVGAAFGFLVLANTGLSLLVATACGTSGAVLGLLFAWLGRCRRAMHHSLEAPPAMTEQPVLRG